MSKHQMEMILNMPLPSALEVCEQATATLGWRVQSKHATGMTCIQIAPTPLATGNPVTVEVRLNNHSENGTHLTLNASNFGFGPFQSNYLEFRVLGTLNGKKGKGK